MVVQPNLHTHKVCLTLHLSTCTSLPCWQKCWSNIYNMLQCVIQIVGNTMHLPIVWRIVTMHSAYCLNAQPLIMLTYSISRLTKYFYFYQWHFKIVQTFHSLDICFLLYATVCWVCVSQLEAVEFVNKAPKGVSVLYQIPQYIVITMAEVLFSISEIQLAYSQVSGKLVTDWSLSWPYLYVP